MAPKTAARSFRFSSADHRRIEILTDESGATASDVMRFALLAVFRDQNLRAELELTARFISFRDALFDTYGERAMVSVKLTGDGVDVLVDGVPPDPDLVTVEVRTEEDGPTGDRRSVWVDFIAPDSEVKGRMAVAQPLPDSEVDFDGYLSDLVVTIPRVAGRSA